MTRYLGKSSRRAGNSQSDKRTAVKEYRVPTPNPDFLPVKMGVRYEKARILPEQSAVGVVSRLAHALRKPGADRGRIFRSASARKVYAYSISPEDPTRVVREDSSGRRTLGRLVRGRFRPLSSARAS